MSHQLLILSKFLVAAFALNGFFASMNPAGEYLYK